MGKQKTGRSGTSLDVEVPIGTRVFDAETKNLLADLAVDGERWIAAEGGSGGLGNLRFKSSTNRTPRNRMPGKSGEERMLDLELMLMADVGLLGFPNAGKSTLVSRLLPRARGSPTPVHHARAEPRRRRRAAAITVRDGRHSGPDRRLGGGRGAGPPVPSPPGRRVCCSISYSPVDGTTCSPVTAPSGRSPRRRAPGRPPGWSSSRSSTRSTRRRQPAKIQGAASGTVAPMAISAVAGTGLSEPRAAVWSRLQSMTAPETLARQIRHVSGSPCERQSLHMTREQMPMTPLVFLVFRSYVRARLRTEGRRSSPTTSHCAHSTVSSAHCSRDGRHGVALEQGEDAELVGTPEVDDTSRWRAPHRLAEDPKSA